MKLSLYSFVKDGLYFDFHIVDMLKHHLPLADEIIVNEGYSADGTYEAIRDIDPRIRIVRTQWDRSDPKTWRIKYVTETRMLCTGDWCVMIDADEFIPEWEFERLREFCATTEKDIAKFRFLHFYGNYKVHCKPDNRPILPAVGHRIHRNLPNVEVWGDASTVRLRGGSADRREYADEEFVCHHFSSVRNPARLRHKWRIQKRRNVDNKWSKMPSFLFDMFPHDWLDEDFLKDLEVYDGPYIKAVRDNPEEFVRDDFALYHLLRQRQAEGERAGSASS